ncbi:IPExxxVDY family protein [Aureisphaera galaxeae]|uniref:IPExxxVDY family protein n=1 Tax=Aureisphaera galaxeae TaxID=1538023 RepID=UPI0023505469|nr:IPExxxVDY family protein [Aureisphaera galaxeae]MDC8005243.1 IPExxxVDY family protein [Aureisphaera galaxeae]
MGVHKIILDDDFAEEFSLIGIHCSEEDYKLAYLLNSQLGFRLGRMRKDIVIEKEDIEASFPIFQFDHETQYTTYYLVGNKCKSEVLREQENAGLFGGVTSEKIVTSYLLPEFEQPDYFLKIESDYLHIPLRKHIAMINEINQVISAYEIDSDKIKSNNHLIFN